ncbi:MAG: hypothetical protein KKD86_12655, partial [Bacteroidetes bacterium]|nr:hypothetical protein [Bacteroidota bacterium]
SITLRSFATEASVNSVNLDWYEMQYPRYIKPYSDSLVFSFSSINTEERKNVLVSGIQSDKISLWQIVPHNKKILVSSTGSSLVFSDTINSSSKYILLAENKIKEPKIFYKKIFTKTSDHSNQTDYILITHPNFISTGQNYADMIGSNYGLTTAVINIEDLYDEFNYGFFNPEVIKEFLKLTHQYWTKPAPQYVFLVGGTTYDYHDNKHKFMGYPKVNNFVPSYGASVSDNWFVIWDSTNANYLQMNIGRLPVTTSEEFERYLQRHISFLNQKYTDWNKKYILFSGGLGDNQSELDILRSANEFISTNLLEPPPIAGVYNHFYKTINPKSNFGPFSQSKVDEAIRNGAVFISYIGHSGTRTWDNSITEPEHLQNDFNRNPLVTDFGCSTARFAEPDVTSFAELFTVSNQSQAIAYIGNASLGFLSTATTFPKIFYSKLLKDSLHSVSDALNNSKHELVANYGNSTVNRLFVLTNTLIGDPIVNLQIPNKPNLVLKREDQKILLDNIDERSEYVNVKLIFNNYGSAPADSFRISVQDFYNSQNVFTLEDKLLIPGYIDSLIVNVPIKNKGGVHRLIVTLDSANEIEEIYEEDNILELEYFVPSIQLKTNLLYQYTTGIDKQFVLYSPITEPESNRVELEYANDAQFINKKKLFIQLDSVVTIVEFDSLEENKRYWIRYKYDNEERFSSSKSFVNSEHKYIANDSLGFSDFYLERLNNKNFLEAGEKEIKFEITSAGWDDGNVAVIQKDGVNYIPYWSTGHHACIFDKDNLEFAGYQTFNLLWGGTAAKNAYINFLDTLSSQYILVISVTDEGTVRYSEIRDKLKLFGSTKIDSVGFRDAWAFIGRKGAAAEEIHEMYKKHLNGPAKINTSYFRRYENGSFQSGLIGPAGSWSKLNLQFENYSDSSVFINVLARKASLDFDTLFYGAGNILDLTSIDASVYSHIKLDGRLNNRTDPPVIVNEISCDYALPAELLTNYQTVTVLYDSVFHNETNKLNFRIYNAGETAAADFTVNVDLLKPDNTIKQLNSFNSVSIDSMSYKKYEMDFQVDSSDGEGQFYLAVN